MKKFIAIMCMAVILVSSALAAGSPKASSITGSVVDKDGKAVSGYVIKVFEGTVAPTDAEVEALGLKDYKQLAVLEVKCFDLNGKEIPLPEDVYIKFDGIEGYESGDIAFAHKLNDKWQKEEVVAKSAKSATVKFTELSPVVIYVKAESEGGNTSEPTGEPFVMTVVALIAMAALIGMAVTAKKEN